MNGAHKQAYTKVVFVLNLIILIIVDTGSGFNGTHAITAIREHS